MDLSAGELPDEPRFDRAEQQLPTFGAVARVRHVVKQPLELRSGEIRVGQKSGLLGDHFGYAAFFLERIRDPRRAAALPDDRVVDGSAACPVPEDRRFALVGDPDALHAAGCARFFQRLRADAALAFPYLKRVVFHPAGLRIVLFEILLRLAGDRAVRAEEDGSRAGRALVERENIVFHGNSPLFHRR